MNVGTPMREKLLGHHLQRDGLAGAGRAGDQPVAIGESGQNSRSVPAAVRATGMGVLTTTPGGHFSAFRVKSSPLTRVHQSPSLPWTLTALIGLVFVAVLIRTAWISDDALITLRTVLNVTHGYGLTYNIAERVQTFTHPLWMALLTAAYTAIGNIYYATFALSMATSLAAFWLAVQRASSATRAVLVAVVLLFSRAFIDFSTSGLENPLSHMLLAAFVIRAVATRETGAGLPALWTLTSLLYLTRPDDVLVVAPALLAATWRAPTWGARARAAAIGLLPAAAWTLGALAYFGFPFPNTAYAKLATGISARETWLQGGLYLVDSFDRDPLTMLAIGLGVFAGVASRGLPRALAVGIVINLCTSSRSAATSCRDDS